MTVLITGARGGLGGAAALYFSALGDFVYALDVNVPKDVGITHNIRHIPLDLTDAAAVERLGKLFFDRGIKLDCVIHFAGVHKMCSLIEEDADTLKRMLDINLLGAARVNRAFFPCLKKGGKIIITTSEVAGQDAMPFNGAYHITKAALDCYAQALRQELNHIGYRVVTLRPGAFETPLEKGSINSMEEMCGKSAYFSDKATAYARLMRAFTGTPKNPAELAKLVYRAAHSKHPHSVYTVGENPYLRLLALLPPGAQTTVVGWAVKIGERGRE